MNKYFFLLFLMFSLGTISVTTSCKAKYGCPSNEQVQPRVNKRGELKSKRSKSKSELFDKKTRKRMGR